MELWVEVKNDMAGGCMALNLQTRMHARIHESYVIVQKLKRRYLRLSFWFRCE
jgi:hypothetical protein